VLIPFSGGAGHYEQASYVDVLRGRFPAERIRGATVVVGVTAQGLSGNVVTPLTDASSPMSGAELVASVFDAVRSRRTLHYMGLEATALLTAGLAVLATVVASVFTPALGAACGAVLPLAAAALLLMAAAVWFTPIAAMVGAVAGSLVWYVVCRSPRFGLAPAVAAPRRVGSVGEAVLTIDAEERVEYLNKIAEGWSGMTQESARGQLASSVLPIMDAQMRPVSYRSLAGRSLIDAFAVGRDRGEPRHVHANVATNRDASGVTRTLVVSLAADDAAAQADPSYDALTGLPARRRLRDHLSQALENVRNTGKQGAVLILDVERLRDVNMSLGWGAGDELLKETANRLRGATIGQGMAGRIGGGEFAVVYEDVRLDEDICALGNRILGSFANPFKINGSEIRVSLRVGVSVFPDDGDDPDTLLQRADSAMRAETASGERPVRIYKRAMFQMSVDRVMLTRALEVALERRELTLVYQPIVDLLTGALIGVEALARWSDNGHGLVPPSTFVPLAEETGLIGALGEWTMEEACRQALEWDAEGMPPLLMSVNVSPRQFLQPSFEKSVRRAIAHAGPIFQRGRRS